MKLNYKILFIRLQLTMDKLLITHIVPTVPIKPNASLKTGLIVEKGEMFHREKKVQTVSKKLAVLGFLDFLKSCKKTNETNVILVRHNVIK